MKWAPVSLVTAAFLSAIVVDTSTANAAGSGGAAAGSPPACELVPAAPMDFVMANASSSEVWLVPENCDLPKAGTQKRVVLTAAPTNSRLVGNLRAVEAAAAPCPGCLAELVLENTADQAFATTSWTVTDQETKKAIGTVTLEVIRVTTSKLAIGLKALDANEKSEGHDDALQVVRTVSPLVAAARTFPKKAEDIPTITNAAETTAPPRIGDLDGLVWRVTASTWGNSVRFWCISQGKVKGHFAQLDPDSTCPVRPDRLLFGVGRRLKTALVVTLELWREGTSPHRLARAFLQLADSAEVASAPIPLWPAARVSCTTTRILRKPLLTTAFVGNTLAIDNGAVENGKCEVVFDYTYASQSCVAKADVDADIVKDDRCLDRDKKHRDPWEGKEWERRVRAGGPQGVEITVSHAGATATIAEQIDPTHPVHIPLPTPISPANTTPPKDDDAYKVTITLKSVAGVSYLEGSLDTTAGNPTTSVAMQLRPRGAFGTSYPVRVSVTFPVTPLTLRSPPKPNEVTTSTDSVRTAIEGPRASAMIVIEPWDYSSAHNLLPIPLQLQTGVSVFQLSESKPFDLNFLVGLAASFPIAGQGASETALSVGGFREYGLQDGRSSWIVTFSIDLFKPIQTSGTK